MAIGLNKNDYQKYGLIAAGGTAFAIFSLLFMAALIATGDVSLDDINTRKIADFLMPERELELMDDSMERPEEQEPPPDMLPPDVEMDTMEDLSGNIAPKFNFKATLGWINFPKGKIADNTGWTSSASTAARMSTVLGLSLIHI